MCILSERCETLNQNAPLAKKLRSAYHELRELRDICRASNPFAKGLTSVKESVYWGVEREYTIEDIKKCIEEMDCRDPDLFGLTPEQVYSDSKIIDSIIEQIEKCACKEYWDDVEYAIGKGIQLVLESRKVVE